jgi:Asp-tRNA(Asn)/Glu-tRNA(Gln) amidotransferase A subunit family amidase
VPLTVKMMKHIFLANLLGLPAISIPIGLDTNRLPFALQLTGDHWTDDQLLSLSRIIDEHYSDGKNGNLKHRPKHFYDVLGATVKQKKP